MTKFRIVLGIVSALTARAVDFNFDRPFSLGPGETAFALSLPKFDSPGYRLQQVKVTLEAMFTGGMTFLNESAVPLLASGSLSSGRVLATPIGTDLLLVPPVSLSLNASTPVPALGEASISPQSNGSSVASSTSQAALDRFQQNNAVYDVDFTALYPPMVAASPDAITCILCNDRVTGTIRVTYTATPPTAVVLQALSATWAGPGVVVVNWRTGVESNLIGFRIEREVASGNWLQVSAGIIPALGGSQPNAYRFEEANVPMAEMVKYRLVQVTTAGALIPLRETIVQVGVKTGIAVTASGIEVGVQGKPNTRAIVEEADDVARGPWVRVGEVALDAGGAGTLALSAPGENAARFYRVVQE